MNEVSKIITLSNLGYFLNKLNLNNSISRLIQNIPTSPKGNIYLDTTNTLLKYKKGGEWYEIALYEEKPTENTLALRIGSSKYYAGLVEPTDEVASDLRIRLNNVVYAVAKEKPSNTGVFSGGRYVYTLGTFTLGGSDDVEVLANLRVNLIDSTNNTYYNGGDQNGPAYFRIYEDGGTVNQSPTFNQSGKYGFEWKRGKTNLAYVLSAIGNITKMWGYPDSFTGSSPTFAQSEAALGIDVEYKFIYTASDNLCKWYFNGEQIYQYNQSSGAKNYTTFQYNTKNNFGNGVTKNFHVAIGDITNNSNIQVTLNDFYVKVSGTQTLGMTDLK